MWNNNPVQNVLETIVPENDLVDFYCGIVILKNDAVLPSANCLLKLLCACLNRLRWSMLCLSC